MMTFYKFYVAASWIFTSVLSDRCPRRLQGSPVQQHSVSEHQDDASSDRTLLPLPEERL